MPVARVVALRLQWRGSLAGHQRADSESEFLIDQMPVTVTRILVWVHAGGDAADEPPQCPELRMGRSLMPPAAARGTARSFS